MLNDRMNIWDKYVLPREISHLNATSVDQSIEFSEKKIVRLLWTAFSIPSILLYSLDAGSRWLLLLCRWRWTHFQWIGQMVVGGVTNNTQWHSCRRQFKSQFFLYFCSQLSRIAIISKKVSYMQEDHLIIYQWISTFIHCLSTICHFVYIINHTLLNSDVKVVSIFHVKSDRLWAKNGWKLKFIGKLSSFTP